MHTTTLTKLMMLKRLRWENHTWQDIADKMAVNVATIYRMVRLYAPELQTTQAVTKIMPYKTTKLTARQKFWKQVQVLSPDECWEWQRGKGGTNNGSQYGRTRCSLTKQSEYTHHLAYWFTYGKRAKPMVLHRCGNSLCCNPLHLYEGNALDNAKDRRTHATQAGIIPAVPLKMIQATQLLLNAGVKTSHIIKIVGIPRSTAYNIKSGKAYAWVT